MEPRINIENELKELCPVLAQNRPLNPFRVPDGYFEQFPGQMLSCVKNEEVPGVLLSARQNPYVIPAGYFESLAAIILNRVKAEEAASAREELELLSPLLGKLSKQTPFSLPEGYFDELPSNIADGAKAIELVNEELENLSPVMNNLKSINVYEVPAGYFDALPESMLQKAKEQQPAKVVSMNFGRKWMRYAAAAVVTGLIIIGGWMYSGVGSGKSADPNEIVKKLTDSELQDYVENQTSGIDNASIGEFEIDANDVKDMLADVSDEELRQYVEQTGEINNSLTN